MARCNVRNLVTNARIAVIILTQNEAANLSTCLDSLEGLDAEIYVGDSGSTDSTLDIARNRGASVLFHKWHNYAHQFNWALDTIQSQASWVFRLDADERLTAELQEFLMSGLNSLPPEVSGVIFRRRTLFQGRWIKH